MMTEAQGAAYGDGLDQSTAHPYMWLLKPHYYGSSFYNWPYTYGLLFGLGLFARYQDDPEHFRAGYDTLLSRAGMDTAEELGQAFDLDVTDEAFWTASLDVVRARMAELRRTGRRSSAHRRSGLTTSWPPSPPPTRYGLTRDEFAAVLDGEPRYRLDQVWSGMYEQLADPLEITNLPKSLRARLADDLPLALDAGDRIGQRQRRHGQVPVGARRRQPGRDRADALPRPGDGVRQQPGRVRDGAAGSAPRARPASPAISPSARSSSRS